MSIYNNEAIATLAIGHFLKQLTRIQHTKLLFVLPFVLHDPTAKRLRGKAYHRSLEEFLIKNTDCVINFSERFEEFLPLTINAVTILNEMNVVRIEKEHLVYNANNLAFNPEGETTIGKRVNDVMKSVEGITEIFKEEDVASFYLKMRITL